MTKISPYLPQQPSSGAAAYGQNISNEQGDEASKHFQEVKTKFTKYAWGTATISTLSLIPFIINFGWTVPAKALQIVGDIFGSLATLSSPFALITNEIKNHKNMIGKLNGNGHNSDVFDKVREVFYRCCSLGFTPFIFEPFLNPEKFGKSIFHKIATIANIPNLIFTGGAWGFGNFQALLAWGLRQNESRIAGDLISPEKRAFLEKATNTNTEEEKELWLSRAEELTTPEEKVARAKEKGFDRIYSSAKRLATIGSIANPTMQGLRQAADSLALITGQISRQEFFQRPLLGASRLVSLFVGIPEFFIKGIDSVVRVLDESKHLEPVLPEFVNGQIKSASAYLDNHIKTKIDKPGFLKSLVHNTEILFHTLSPLSMFALFTPMLDEPCLSEEAQSRGGVAGLLDKVIGRTGKALTFIFTGSYVAFARLPQTLIQSVFFFNKKFFNKSDAQLKDILHNKLANNPVISGISNVARKCVDFLVENYYSAEHQHSYLNFEQVVASESFDQAKEEYKLELTQAIKEKTISSKLIKTIVEYCLKFADGNARKDYHTLTPLEETEIENLVRKKINDTLDLSNGSSDKPQLKPRFPGAYFLATYFFRLFDIKERILKTDCSSSHRNMKIVYKREELDISFEGELYPVLTECVQGLRRTVNLVQGITS